LEDSFVRRLAVITGTTHGIGRVSARELAKAGYSLVMLCRDLAAAGAVREEILRVAPGADIRSIRCDLASLRSVRECAQAVRDGVGPFKLLINNAGMVSTRHRMSEDGFELTFASNHLGPFLLTRLLTDRLQAGGRIISVASRAHYPGKMDLESVTDPRARYRSMAAYSRSKLANVMFTFALSRRLEGTGVTANCLHPGVVATNLLPRWLKLIKPLLSRVMFDADRGSQTTLYLALSDEAQGVSGRYFDEHHRDVTASRIANDVALQESLWEASERWTGLRTRTAD
jgi:NAD(P)-dependent dehydrogenase (short-subunit alcohol dehydrogenase family)